jgi:hypothetical protein
MAAGDIDPYATGLSRSGHDEGDNLGDHESLEVTRRLGFVQK